MCRLRAKCCRAVEHHATDHKREVKGGTGMGQWRGHRMKRDGIVKLCRRKQIVHHCYSLLFTYVFLSFFHNHVAICPGMGSFRGNIFLFPTVDGDFLPANSNMHYRFRVEWYWINIVIILGSMYINVQPTVLLAIDT